MSQPLPDSVAEAPNHATQPSLRVLVAEDEHLIAADLVENLRQLGHRPIGPVATGKQAIELAKRDRPDLALLDIRMPEMDGLTAAGVLFCQMDIPVVIVSAYSDNSDLATAARIGVFGYLLKPVTADELRVQLAVAWSRFTRHSELRQNVQQLKTSLEDRKVIEAAKGLLMAKLGISEAEAMTRLRKQARDARRKMADLARALVQTSEMLEP